MIHIVFVHTCVVHVISLLHIPVGGVGGCESENPAAEAEVLAAMNNKQVERLEI